MGILNPRHILVFTGNQLCLLGGLHILTQQQSPAAHVHDACDGWTNENILRNYPDRVACGRWKDKYLRQESGRILPDRRTPEQRAMSCARTLAPRPSGGLSTPNSSPFRPQVGRIPQALVLPECNPPNNFLDKSTREPRGRRALFRREEPNPDPNPRRFEVLNHPRAQQGPSHPETIISATRNRRIS